MEWIFKIQKGYKKKENDGMSGFKQKSLIYYNIALSIKNYKRNLFLMI